MKIFSNGCLEGQKRKRLQKGIKKVSNSLIFLLFPCIIKLYLTDTIQIGRNEMETKKIVTEVDGLFKIIHLQKLRETKGVVFDMVPKEFVDQISGIDRVIHQSNAVSPGSIGGVERPWYMHPYQSDNLIVLYGERHVDLYSVKHGRVESFIVTPTAIYQNGELLCDTPSMLVWPPNVFHRVESKKEGSASLNFALRSDGFNIDNNFSIYDLNPVTGEYKVIRVGKEDQFV